MKYFTSSKFWKCFDKLPSDIQNLARQNYALLKRNSSYPALHFKPIRGTRYYSFRVGIHYRALGVIVPEGIQWFWIGSHAQYDKLLS